MMIPPVLCLVTDRRRFGPSWPDALVEQVRAAARAGIHLVQVREPDLDGGALRDLVVRCLDATRGTRVRVLVNDRVDVAIAAGAHGVHLRADSIQASRVRRLCPRPFLIGRSIHSGLEAAEANARDLDYVILGTVFPTSSKPDVVPAGIETLAAAVSAAALPVLAIGGMTVQTWAVARKTGAAGLAAIGIFAEDPEGATRQLLTLPPPLMATDEA